MRLFLTFVCLEYTFRIYMLLHIKKHYFIYFCCLFLKLLKAFSASLSSEFLIIHHIAFEGNVKVPALQLTSDK